MRHSVIVNEIGNTEIIFSLDNIVIKYPLMINGKQIKIESENSLWICPIWKIDTLLDLNSDNKNWILSKFNGIYNAENVGYKKFSTVDDCIQEINDDLNLEVGLFYKKDSVTLYFPISYVLEKYKHIFNIFSYVGMEQFLLENIIKRDKYIKWICKICDLKIDLKESKSYMWIFDKVIKIKMISNE